MQRIRRRLVEGPLMAVHDRGPVRHGAHQLGTPLDGGEAVRGHRDGRYGHAVELRGVEDGEVPEHKTLLLVPGFGVFFGVDLPEDDRDAALALADAAPSRFHLVERGPERGRVAHRRQQPDVDAAIGPLAEKIARQPRRVVPGLLPGHGALLQQYENPVCYHLVRCVDLLCYTHGRNLHGDGWLKDVAVRELPLPHGFFLLSRGLCLAGAPGAVGNLVAIPGAARVLPRLHHDRMVGTPPRLQAARDQLGPYQVLHKHGQAFFRHHVQAHLLGSQMLLRAWVIDEETQLPVDPAPIFLVISKKFLHGLSPFPGVFLRKKPPPSLAFPAGYVTAKAHRGSPGLPPFDGEVKLALRGCSAIERLALCSVVFAPSFRSAATAGGRVSRLGRSPTRRAWP